MKVKRKKSYREIVKNAKCDTNVPRMVVRDALHHATAQSEQNCLAQNWSRTIRQTLPQD